uniref:Putative secreted protein n=1 Tax=Anopheles darlingi TaxID=43151 RepID=A0A2M4DNT3_ANODA
MLNFISSIPLRALLSTIIVRFFTKTYALNRLFCYRFPPFDLRIGERKRKKSASKIWINRFFFVSIAKIHPPEPVADGQIWVFLGRFGDSLPPGTSETD